MYSSWADWFPYFAGIFTLVVFGIGGYYAIQWHFDEERRVREAEGIVLAEPSTAKKMMVVVASLIALTILTVVLVYATNWLLYE